MAGLARTYIHRHTLLWGTDGIRALPVALWSEFYKEVQAFKRELKEKGCELQVYYIAYPEDVPNVQGDSALFDMLEDERARRQQLMERDLTIRVEQVVSDLNQRLKMDFVDGVAKPRRFHEETLRGLTYEVRLFKDRKSTRLNSSHSQQSRMPSSA